jgi:hypothetical protein
VDAALRERAAPSERVIRITAAEIDRLRAQWTKQYQRPPGPAELRSMVDLRAREEVFYREALAMGLDQGDDTIRRRLAQTFEFLTADLAASREPTQAELRAYFDGWPERYRLPARVSFSHVYFSPDRRGRATEAHARLVLAGLRAGKLAAAAADQGDRFMMGESYSEQSAQDVEAVFGPEFVRALFEVAPGDGWSGPIASPYGWHLVRVEARSHPRVPALAEIRERVRQDWSYEQRRQANEAVFERLRSRYEVVIEGEAQSALGTAPAVEKQP